jgi:glycosyltransferase involved in cell wall biosynthesis
MARPLVTAIIDTYNHERFIEQAIVSVLEQAASPSEMEVLVVDDGSTDGTPEIVEKFAPRVRHLRKPNGGQASAFNAAIPEARGEVVAFLDGDDWWARDKLPVVLECLEKNPDVGSVGHGYYEVHDGEVSSGTVIPERPQRLQLRDRAGAELFRQLRAFLGTSKVTIRKRVLERVLPIPEALVIEADEYMFTLAAAVAGALVLDKPLFYYRFHSGNLFQFEVGDADKLRRKQRVLACLVRELPPPLRAAGVPEDAIRPIIEPVWIEAERLRLSLDGGSPWETFQAERAGSRLAYKDASSGYHVFKTLVFGLTLILPPRRFYQLREWYTARGLRRVRQFMGEPVPAAPILEQKRAAPQ